MALSSFTQIMIEISDKFTSARPEDLSERKILNRYFPRMLGYIVTEIQLILSPPYLSDFRVQQELVIGLHDDAPDACGMKAGISLQGSSPGVLTGGKPFVAYGG